MKKLKRNNTLSKIMAVLLMMSAVPVEAGDAKFCVSVSHHKMTNTCNKEITLSYCMPNSYTSKYGNVFIRTCNTGSGGDPYYSHTTYIPPGETRTLTILPIGSNRRFYWAACFEGTSLHSNSNGDFKCVPWGQ